MKILVTGAAGFLGSRVVDLLSNMDYQIVTTDRLGQCDLVGDLANPAFTKLLPETDVIIHCAAVQYVTKNKPLFNWRSYFERNNVVATDNLLNRYRGTNVHLVHVGTSMQYHQNDSDFYSEDSYMSPQGVYSWSKLEAQKLVDSSGLKTATVIPCIIGGSGREGLFKGFVNSIDSFSVAVIPGKGNYPISIVHVDDVAILLVEVVVKGLEGYFNAAAPDALSIIEWAHIVQDALGKRRLYLIHLPLRPLRLVSKLLGYRLLANEQLVMLSMPHVINTRNVAELKHLKPKNSRTIIMDIVNHLKNP